jgi:hypothetical protein
MLSVTDTRGMTDRMRELETREDTLKATSAATARSNF